MGHCVRLVIPDVAGCESTIAEVMGRIARRYGGCTSYKGQGVYFSDDKECCISDHVVIVECSFGWLQASDKSWWTQLSADIAESFKQECVFLSVREERARLIGPDGLTRAIGLGGE